MNWLSHWDEYLDIELSEKSSSSKTITLDDTEYEPISLDVINKLFGEDN